MEPTSVLLGVLLASTKGLALAAIGFGVAWWRGRRQIARLESTFPQADELAARMERVEASLEYSTAALERLLAGQNDLLRAAGDTRRALPGGPQRGLDEPEITPH
jgi:hypothetical protein